MPPTQQQHQQAADAGEDPRPRYGIGHMVFTAQDVKGLAEFYAAIGMRPVVAMDRFAILELRGGTHIIFQPGPAGVATIDVIVDDIDDTHAVLAAAGANPTDIERGSPHDRFIATDPEGNTLAVNSNHAIGPV